MGMTLAIFNLLGTKPVSRDLFIILVIGTAVKCIYCCSILVDIPSWLKLDLGLSFPINHNS